MKQRRYLVLEDGSYYPGYAFGSEKDAIGEIVFNTGMTGYQETLSDPSYTGQIITFTYPLIGNYGINEDDFEGLQPGLKGMVIHELADHPSNFRCTKTLDEALKHFDVPGIYGVDTRSITKKIRSAGVMRGTMVNNADNLAEIVAGLKAYVLPTDEIQMNSVKEAQRYAGEGPRVVLMDFGFKDNILAELRQRGCEVIVVPWNTSAESILAYQPEGIMLSNGPGDPTSIPEAIATIKTLMNEDNLPIFGICLGHQLIALAGGAKTYKMKFGHRGANHPVQDVVTGKVSLTSQNHGYAVDEDSLAQTDFVVTHRALNDGTNEGIRHKTKPIFSVQYHPEAAPGPHDANYLFDEFVGTMIASKGGNKHA